MRASGPGVQHPLMGARLSTLLLALIKNGGVDRRYVGLVSAMVASAIARWPLEWADKAAEGYYRRVSEPMVDPVFIVGHWRSGTTHLHNLLAQSSGLGIITPLAAGLPNQMFTLVVWLRALLEKALPPDRHVDKVAVTPFSPQEDEIPLANQQLLSVFHAVYFPHTFERSFRRTVFWEGVAEHEVGQWARQLRRFLEKVSWHQQKAQLLVKNPVYTARLDYLSKLFPHARFIHIRRNPYAVYASTRLYYRRLFGALALQSYEHVDIEEVILRGYRRLMDKYIEDSKLLPTDRLIEVSYEELQSHPIGTLHRIHKALTLSGWEKNCDRVQCYIDSLSGFQKNTWSLSDADIFRVRQAWGSYICRWSYPVPDISER